MDNLTSRERERELEGDLESGGTTSEEDSAENPVSIDRHEKGIFNKFWSSLSGSNSSSNVLKSGESANVNVFLIEKNSEDESNEHVSLVDYKCLEGKQKKNNPRKPTKPPRPPKGPTLDAADQKLVREIAEFAMRKRARNEKIKALKKMKVVKVSKSNTALSAMIITVIFCIIIIFQGLSSGSSVGVSLQGSPAPAVSTSESLVSIQFHKNFYAYEGNAPGPGFLNSSAV